jgi:hypothetical protein
MPLDKSGPIPSPMIFLDRNCSPRQISLSRKTDIGLFRSRKNTPRDYRLAATRQGFNSNIFQLFVLGKRQLRKPSRRITTSITNLDRET